MLNNNQLQEAVRDELKFDPSFTESDIAVSASDGAVSLTGFVPSFSEKRYAARAVERVAGVRNVKDEIRVRLPTGSKLSDSEITTRATQILAWTVTVPPTVKATVHEGMVTLTGETPFGFQRTAAETSIARLDGVIGIDNRITVKPASPLNAATPAFIDKALQRLDFELGGITVTAHDGKVSLKGAVRNAYQRDLAEHVAWSAPGVSQVHQELSIN